MHPNNTGSIRKPLQLHGRLYCQLVRTRWPLTNAAAIAARKLIAGRAAYSIRAHQHTDQVFAFVNDSRFTILESGVDVSTRVKFLSTCGVSKLNTSTGVRQQRAAFVLP